MKPFKILCIVSALGSLFVAPQYSAAQDDDSRAIAGIDLGVVIPSTDKTWARLEMGGIASPYVGYMFDNSFGLQANIHAALFSADEHGPQEVTTLLGLTAGPRLSLPWTENFETYLTGQGGVFGGVSGRVEDEVDGGVSLGGGFDFYMTPQVAFSLWGRWNYVFIKPDPDFQPKNIPSEENAENLQYVSAGIGLKFDFRDEEVPPPPPPVVAKAAPTPAPLPAPSRKRIVLRGVRFDFDKSNIRSDARPILDEAIRTLKEQGDVAVVVEGHTDARGTEAYNLKLSQRRAQSVKQYLTSHGVSSNRLTVEAYGESRPVASNDDEEGRAQNRRVELNVKE